MEIVNSLDCQSA